METDIFFKSYLLNTDPLFVYSIRVGSYPPQFGHVRS